MALGPGAGPDVGPGAVVGVGDAGSGWMAAPVGTGAGDSTGIRVTQPAGIMRNVNKIADNILIFNGFLLCIIGRRLVTH